MSVKNKRIFIILLFFTGILMYSGFSLISHIRKIQSPTKLILQYINNRQEDLNTYNTFAEFPDNEISFDLNSRISIDEAEIPDNLCLNNDFSSMHIVTSGFSNKIFLSHLIFSIIDLPPPV